jgi:hypothetical protein
VNADLDYKRLGLTVDPEKFTLRPMPTTGFLFTQPPRKQQRPGLAQAIGSSVPIVSGNQPLPPLMTIPPTMFGQPQQQQEAPMQQSVQQSVQQIPQMPTVGSNQSQNQFGQNIRYAPPTTTPTSTTTPISSLPQFSQFNQFSQMNTPNTQQNQFNLGMQQMNAIMPQGNIINPRGNTNQNINAVTQGIGSMNLQPSRSMTFGNSQPGFQPQTTQSPFGSGPFRQ